MRATSFLTVTSSRWIPTIDHDDFVSAVRLRVRPIAAHEELRTGSRKFKGPAPIIDLCDRKIGK